MSGREEIAYENDALELESVQALYLTEVGRGDSPIEPRVAKTTNRINARLAANALKKVHPG
jgi:hypothetical protein